MDNGIDINIHNSLTPIYYYKKRLVKTGKSLEVILKGINKSYLLLLYLCNSSKIQSYYFMQKILDVDLIIYGI